jgi:hypothetical protein
MTSARETKIFDPADGFAPFVNPWVATDATVARRGKRWWMYLAGKLVDHETIEMFSASLPDGAPLSATGWALTADPARPTHVGLLAGHEASARWDLKGGRHCPSYVEGIDPHTGRRVERLYYAGGADEVWGPYAIGYLEWDGERWVDQPEPAFVAEEPWERGSVYEPNLVYYDGRWRLWYVAGSNREDYLVPGFSESEDGRGGWSRHTIVFQPEEKVFAFAVTPTARGFEAVFSRVWLAAGVPPANTGLWWCEAKAPSADPADWSTPVQIMTGEDRGWHAGPWKPCLRDGEADPRRMFVFFGGQYTVPGRAGFPYVFTLGCLEMDRPR